MTFLKWPKEMWSLFNCYLYCCLFYYLYYQLTGKVQEVCAALSVADGLDYEIVLSYKLMSYSTMYSLLERKSPFFLISDYLIINYCMKYFR